MKITLQPAGDASCTLKQVTPSVSVEFPLPLATADVVALLRAILADPEAREVGAGPVSADRMRDGIRLSVGSGTFTVPYAHAFPLFIEA